MPLTPLELELLDALKYARRCMSSVDHDVAHVQAVIKKAETKFAEPAEKVA